MKIKLGISTCPNDTFAFHAILNRKIDLRGLEIETTLLDVQQLNKDLKLKTFDFSKASSYAALENSDSYQLLRSGSAMGFGVGPLLLANKTSSVPNSTSKVLCPGKNTTAFLLFKNFYPEAKNIEEVVFSEIMPALKKEEADFGIVIHEGRFTYQEEGLILVSDLGKLWEDKTKLPLPLGVILARSTLSDKIKEDFNIILKKSVQYAYQNKEETFLTMQKYAQELEPEVIWKHVELYVNELTIDMGDLGLRAINELSSVCPENRFSQSSFA